MKVHESDRSCDQIDKTQKVLQYLLISRVNNRYISTGLVLLFHLGVLTLKSEHIGFTLMFLLVGIIYSKIFIFNRFMNEME